MRRLRLLPLGLLLCSCAASAPVTGARVLDLGQYELTTGLEAGIADACEGGDMCTVAPFIAPTLGLRAGLVDRWLELGARGTPSDLALDLKVELVRTEWFAAALDPSFRVAFGDVSSGYGAPRAWQQALGIAELSPTRSLAVVLFGGPAARLSGLSAPARLDAVVGAGLDWQLTAGTRLHPWLALRLPPGLDGAQIGPPGIAAGIGFGFGDAVRAPSWGEAAPGPG